MSMTHCPSCRCQVSAYAAACPNCGHPKPGARFLETLSRIAANPEIGKNIDKAYRKNAVKGCAVALAIAVVIIGGFILAVWCLVNPN